MYLGPNRLCNVIRRNTRSHEKIRTPRRRFLPEWHVDQWIEMLPKGISLSDVGIAAPGLEGGMAARAGAPWKMGVPPRMQRRTRVENKRRRAITRGAEHALDAEDFMADGVTVAERGEHLVNGRMRRVAHRPPPECDRPRS